MCIFRNSTWSMVVVLLTASIPLTGCKAKEDVPTVEVTVEAIAVAKQPLTEEVTSDAVLAPLAQAAITPKITAPVRQFYVQRGAKVKAGQLLAVLENRDLTAVELDNKGAYEQAQAAYATATKASVPEDYQKAEQDVAFATELKRRLDEIGPMIIVFQDIKKGKNVTGVDADEIRSGRIAVTQKADDVEGLTGVEAKTWAVSRRRRQRSR